MTKGIAVALFACVLASQSELQSDEACDDSDDTCALQAGVQAVMSTSENSTADEVLTVTCHNEHGAKFACAKGNVCCGNVCSAGPCCTNYVNYKFGCGKGSTCCGNACAAPGSKCCNVGGLFGPSGYEYPVSKATKCADVQLPQECTNPKTKAKFWCGHDDQCCGGACVAKDGVCCTNEHGDGFGCAKDNSCCGNACASAESKCCKTPTGPWFPLTKKTKTAAGVICK